MSERSSDAGMLILIVRQKFVRRSAGVAGEVVGMNESMRETSFSHDLFPDSRE